MLIQIDPLLKEKCPQLQLGVVACKVKIETQYPDLDQVIKETCQRLEQETLVEHISKIPTITAARRAYKAVGKDPARYRLSAEALLRRVVKGKGLYRINNVVDLLNLVSIQTGLSIGGYDEEKVQGASSFGIGLEGEPYEGIGRGELNIHCMPIFRDEQGPYGSPTSDSARTMVSAETQDFRLVFFGFGGAEGLEKGMALATDYLEKYASATAFRRTVIV